MKILIVEDDYISQKKLEKLLNSLNYSTIVAADGKEAFDIWKKEKPEVVITDWMMPKMSGIELCRKIREIERYTYTYIILVTSKSSVEDIVEGLDAGADDFISKPYIKEVLAVRIRAGARLIKAQARDIVIFAMANLVDSRHPETGHHLEKVRHFCKVLTESLAGMEVEGYEVDQNFIDDIFLTSPLHDIGKIGIPDYVLLKSDALGANEFEIMKRHCEIGYETLNNALMKQPSAEYLKMSANIAYYHHEKYDGSGYPRGLKGDEIPLEARITALADVYDALVSKRVYKSASSHEVARATILKSRGKHFDPVIVDAFLKCEEKFIEIFNRFNQDEESKNLQEEYYNL